MLKRMLLIALGMLFALLVVPVLLAQLNRPQPVPGKTVNLDRLSFEKIRFENPVQGVGLAGMLFVPKGGPPFPAVVIIHGSGFSHRTNSLYLTFASYLQENGILVLLPDKRGSESSGGEWRTSSLEDLATDTDSAISYLKTERAPLVQGIGILGFSQGGIIASIVAAGPSDLAFAINVVGGAVPMHDQFVYEENNHLRQMGFLPGLSNAIASLTTFVHRNVIQRDFWSAVGNFDPLPYWQEVEVPALVLLGDQDTNVPSDRSRDRLNALGKDNLRIIVFEGSGHGLEPPVGTSSDYSIREDALELIKDFILGTAATP